MGGAKRSLVVRNDRLGVWILWLVMSGTTEVPIALMLKTLARGSRDMEKRALRLGKGRTSKAIEPSIQYWSV